MINMGKLGPINIRKRIEAKLGHALQDPEKKKVARLERRGAYGHEAGTPIEEWAKSRLDEIDWDVDVYFPNEFLEKFFSNIGKNEDEILKTLEQTWWGFEFRGGRLLITPQQIEDFVEGRPIKRWQQEAGDIILFYGDNLLNDANNIILLNVKSHDEDRASRPPNIMSAERLLKFFFALLSRPDASEMLNKVNLWFVGAGYTTEEAGAAIASTNVRDLFLLDLSELPQINFDAAIQIQWHVKDMVEMSEQDKLTFIESLADTFEEQWQRHVGGKQEKYEKLTGPLKELVKKLRNNSFSK